MRAPSLLELVTDSKDGRLNTSKIGEVVVGAVWTGYMVSHVPDDVFMWLAYAGTLLGWSSVRYAWKNRK